MIITDRARQYIEKMMEGNEGATLRIRFEDGGCSCGPNLSVTLSGWQEGDEREVINGIDVNIDQKAVEAIADKTLDFEGMLGGNILVIKGSTCCS